MGHDRTALERARQLLAPLVLLTVLAPAFAEDGKLAARVTPKDAFNPVSGTVSGRSGPVPIEAGGCTSVLLNGQIPDELNNDLIWMLELLVLQERLRDRGYYSGPIDGALGPLTRAAVRRCQKSQNSPATRRLYAQTAR